MDLDVLNQLRRYDCALLYGLFIEELGENGGTLYDVSFESIAQSANKRGLTTGRGSAFTARVIRDNLAAMERVGAVRKLGQRGDVCFDVNVFNLHASNDENGNGNKARKGEDTKEEFININSKTNKQILKFSFRKSNETEQIANDSEESPADRNETETTDDNRNDGDGGTPSETVNDVVACVDFTNERVARLRSKLSRDVYEAGLHADLVDRAVAAVVKGLATVHELQAAVREARDEKKLLETTNGFRGARTLWQTFCRRVKDWFDAAGVVWIPTSNRREPEPVAVVASDSDEELERLLANDARLRAKSLAEFRPMKRRLACV